MRSVPENKTGSCQFVTKSREEQAEMNVLGEESIDTTNIDQIHMTQKLRQVLTTVLVPVLLLVLHYLHCISILTNFIYVIIILTFWGIVEVGTD